jgi:hypothetical protein
MRRRPLAISLAVVAAMAADAAPPATAKEGVKATLTTWIPTEAPAGTRVTLTWKLALAGGKPFGANGVFVRLRSAAGAGAETGVAPSGAYETGEYAATVVVPKGGIGDVQIGLHGWSDGQPSDLLFPITNDPLPGAPRAALATSRGGGVPAWVFIAAAGSVSALLAVALAFARRRNADAQSLPRTGVRPRGA